MLTVPNSSCPQKIVCEGRPLYLCRGLPYINRFHMVSYTGYLLFSLTESILPLPPALSVFVCVSPSLPSHMHVSFVHRTDVTHPCASRIARCPPTGLIPRYRLDEFMSEVTIFPCSKPLSGGSQALWLVLESHLFLFLLLAR
jgi:hypothetical protein